MVLPTFKEWIEKTFGASLEHKTTSRVSKWLNQFLWTLVVVIVKNRLLKMIQLFVLKIASYIIDLNSVL